MNEKYQEVRAIVNKFRNSINKDKNLNDFLNQGSRVVLPLIMDLEFLKEELADFFKDSSQIKSLKEQGILRWQQTFKSEIEQLKENLRYEIIKEFKEQGDSTY